jgi:hypothetical protein
MQRRYKAILVDADASLRSTYGAVGVPDEHDWTLPKAKKMICSWYA